MEERREVGQGFWKELNTLKHQNQTMEEHRCPNVVQMNIWNGGPQESWLQVQTQLGCTWIGEQSVTYRYREFLVPGIPGTGNFSFFWWYRNRYRKKVSESVSEKIGTGKRSRNRYRKNLVPEKSLGTGIGKIWYRKKSRNWNLYFCCQNLGIYKICDGYRYRKGTGIRNFHFFWWYRNRYQINLVPKKVSEPVSEIFGIGKKVSVSVLFEILGTVTHCVN